MILNAKEYRDAWFWLGVYEKMLPTVSITDMVQMRYAIQRMKREIREYRDKYMETEVLVSVSDDYYDHEWTLIALPVGITDKRTAREYFKNNYYQFYKPQAWDCTGQWWTTSYIIWQRETDHRWMVWHKMNHDV